MHLPSKVIESAIQKFYQNGIVKIYNEQQVLEHIGCKAEIIPTDEDDDVSAIGKLPNGKIVHLTRYRECCSSCDGDIRLLVDISSCDTVLSHDEKLVLCASNLEQKLQMCKVYDTPKDLFDNIIMNDVSHFDSSSDEEFDFRIMYEIAKPRNKLLAHLVSKSKLLHRAWRDYTHMITEHVNDNVIASMLKDLYILERVVPYIESDPVFDYIPTLRTRYRQGYTKRTFGSLKITKRTRRGITTE